MKKYLLMSLFVIGATVASADSYLYWMGSAPEGRTWDYAQLMYTTTADYNGTKVVDAAAERISGQNVTYSSWADITGFDDSNYSFYIEYMSEGSQTASFSSAILSYDSIKDSIKDSLTTMGVKSATFNVPEPTSGMMLLLGMGLLALKRKKA